MSRARNTGIGNVLVDDFIEEGADPWDVIHFVRNPRAYVNATFAREVPGGLFVRTIVGDDIGRSESLCFAPGVTLDQFKTDLNGV